MTPEYPPPHPPKLKDAVFAYFILKVQFATALSFLPAWWSGLCCGVLYVVQTLVQMCSLLTFISVATTI